MTEVIAEHMFPLPIDELWSYLGDFGDTGKWSGRPKEACVQHGEGIGALRTLHIADGQQIVDRLEDQTPYSYTYSVVEGNLPWKHYKATMSVTAVDEENTKFTWRGVFEPLGMTEEQCAEFTRNVYAMGIGMMKKTIPGAG